MELLLLSRFFSLSTIRVSSEYSSLLREEREERRWSVCLTFTFFPSILHSPDHNPAVLQRSELVALINTAHRFAESVSAQDVSVEGFEGEGKQLY